MLAAVRCAPPANAPTPAERDTCAPWARRGGGDCCCPHLRAAVALGAFAWQSLLGTLGRLGLEVPRPRPRFGHGAEVELGEPARRRVVPPQPAEHLHRPAHRADARPGHGPRGDKGRDRSYPLAHGDHDGRLRRAHPHPDRRRWVRRHVHRAAAATPAAQRAQGQEGRDHRRRPAVVHDLPAVPARGGGRQRRAAARRRPAAPGARAGARSSPAGSSRSTTSAGSRASSRPAARRTTCPTRSWCWRPAPSRAPCRSRAWPSRASASSRSRRPSRCATRCSRSSTSRRASPTTRPAASCSPSCSSAAATPASRRWPSWRT